MNKTTLPVKHVVITLHRLIKHKQFSLLKTSIPYMLLNLVLTYYLYNNIEHEKLFDSYDFIGLMLLSSVIYIMTCIKVHRIFLLSSQKTNITNTTYFLKRQFRYMGWIFVTGLCCLLVSIPFIFLLFGLVEVMPELLIDNLSLFNCVTLLIILPIGYFFIRWSMVFPATAIDKNDNSLEWSWSLTKGLGFQAYLLMSIVPITLMIIQILFSTFDSLLARLIYSLTATLSLIIEIGLLSIIFEYLQQDRVHQSPRENEHLLMQ